MHRILPAALAAVLSQSLKNRAKFISRQSSLAKDGPQNTRMDVARMHGDRHQQVSPLELKVTPFLTNFVKAESLERSSEPTRVGHWQFL